MRLPEVVDVTNGVLSIAGAAAAAAGWLAVRRARRRAAPTGWVEHRKAIRDALAAAERNSTATALTDRIEADLLEAADAWAVQRKADALRELVAALRESDGLAPVGFSGDEPDDEERRDKEARLEAVARARRAYELLAD